MKTALRLSLAVALLLGLALLLWRPEQARAPIRVGVLHSLTGTMAVSERPLAAAVRLAVDEINGGGGLLGRRLEIVLADTRSDPALAAREAERLITREGVAVLFGCWTSACRKAVRPVVERHGHLLFYPIQYEGLEQSPNIIYTGAAPNQQIVPGARWAMAEFGRRVYLLGSDYVFPHTANLIIRDLVAAAGGSVVGEYYLPLGSQALAAAVAEIVRLDPDVVLSTLNGDSNAAYFDALLAAGQADRPLLSFSVAEPELAAWGGGRLHRHYGVWNYFQSTPGARNRAFVAAYLASQRDTPCTSDPIEATYVGVRLWANAVREVGAAEPTRVNTGVLLRQSIEGPGGVAAIDAATRHMWKRVRIGHVQRDGQYREVLAYASHLRPAPWPTYRDHATWQSMTAGPP